MWLSICAILFLYVTSMPVVARYAFRMLEGPAYRIDPLILPRADAIVVLSGMLVGVQSPSGIVYEWSDPDRFLGGIELFKVAKADKLIFTAGRTPWHSQTEPEGAILKRFAIAMGVPSDNILLTEVVQNTEQEARAVRKLIPTQRPHILLVTSAYHMKRSVELFVAQGLLVTPYPVDFRVEIRELTPMDFLPDASALATTSFAQRELLGRAYYGIIRATP